MRRKNVSFNRWLAILLFPSKKRHSLTRGHWRLRHVMCQTIHLGSTCMPFHLGLPYRNAAELILPRGRPEYSVDRSSPGLSAQSVESMQCFLPKRKKPSHHSRDQGDHHGKLFGGLSSRSYDHARLSFSAQYSNSL